MSNKDKTNNFIEQLAKKNPQPCLFSPLKRSSFWVLAVLAYLFVLFYALLEPRADIVALYSSLTFTFEQLVSLSIGILAGVLAFYSSTPGEKATNKGKWMPLILMGLLISCVTFGDFFWHQHASPAYMAKGMHCALNISLIALPPLFLLLFLLRKAASTKPMLSGFLAVLSVSAFGYFAVRNICPDDSIQHHVSAHLLPLLAYSIAGFWIGKKFLKW